jgi:hypothetical protein
MIQRSLQIKQLVFPLILNPLLPYLAKQNFVLCLLESTALPSHKILPSLGIC